MDIYIYANIRNKICTYLVIYVHIVHRIKQSEIVLIVKNF